jgi:hypothetical protein
MSKQPAARAMSAAVVWLLAFGACLSLVLPIDVTSASKVVFFAIVMASSIAKQPAIDR